MKNTPKADLVIDALLKAIWRRALTEKVLIHSYQGLQYTCQIGVTFLKNTTLKQV